MEDSYSDNIYVTKGNPGNGGGNDNGHCWWCEEPVHPPSTAAPIDQHTGWLFVTGILLIFLVSTLIKHHNKIASKI